MVKPSYVSALRSAYLTRATLRADGPGFQRASAGTQIGWLQPQIAVQVLLPDAVVISPITSDKVSYVCTGLELMQSLRLPKATLDAHIEADCNERSNTVCGGGQV